jgi:hypothetical protein
MQLESDLLSLIGRFNRAHDATIFVPREYLEVVIDRGDIAATKE